MIYIKDMDIENSFEYIQLKALFNQLFDRIAEKMELPVKVERIKTNKQILNLKKKALMDKLMKSREA